MPAASSTLIIAEKPNAAAKIAAALSDGKTTRQGRKVAFFEFERNGEHITVAPAVGHVYGLRAKAKGSGYPVFDVEWAPSSETSESSAFTKDYLDQLGSLSKKASRIVVATDYDIEGSLIGWNIVRFNAPGKPASRMAFSTLVAEDLVDAFEHPQPMDVKNAQAGEARHELDWLYGINLSRALMGAIRAAGAFRVMSIGRVQGPSLNVLVERERAIAAFKPTPYWELHALVKKVDFQHEKGKFTDKKLADAAHAASKPDGVVEKVESKKISQLPPFPYDLTTMQLDAYRAFGFTPSQTLSLAQTLYESGFISYPRTASNKLPAKLNLKKIIEKLGGQPAYASLARTLLTQNRIKPHEGPKEDAAHPALHPTGLPPSGGGERELKLYDLIARRFLACFAAPAKRESQRVTLRLGSEAFAASGAHTVEPGWMTFFPYAKLDEVTLPQFRDSEHVRAEKIDLVEKMTQPPKRFSPATVIKKMEDLGIGTKATRSEVLETLYARGYIEDKKSIRVTPLGATVTDVLAHHAPEILSEQLTKKFEEEMEEIAAGRKPPTEVVGEGRELLAGVLAKFKREENEAGKELLTALRSTQQQARTLGVCKVCAQEGRAGQLVIRKSQYGYFVGCDQYPACRNLYPLPKEASIQSLNKICPQCGTPQVKVLRKGKRPFMMCLDPTCPTKAGWGKPAQTSAASAGKIPTAKTAPSAEPKTKAPKPKSARRNARI